MLTIARRKDIYGYFRLGLVTGLVDREALIAWADQEVMTLPVADSEIIELSLATNRSYSEIIWLLGEFEGQADYGLAVNLLMAHAGFLLEQEPDRTTDIIMGLRLLNEEHYVPGELRAEIAGLRQALTHHKEGAIPWDDVQTQLEAFLTPYQVYRSLLARVVNPFGG